LAVLAIEIAILMLHLWTDSSVEGSFWLLTIVTVVSAVVFLIGGLKWRKNKLSA
jgi:O-antigen/teichoic acid export membrane protein